MSAIAALLLAAATLTARQSTRTIEQPLPAIAPSFRVSHSFGSCTVQVAPAGQPPRARLELVASGGTDATQERRHITDATQERRYLDLCGLEVAADGVVRSTFPTAEQKAESISFAANLTLWLPAGADLDLEQRFGAVNIDGAFGKVVVRSKLGAVAVSGAQGDVVVRGEWGAISVRDLRGSATLSTKSASITAERVGGHVDARTRGAFLRIDGAGSVHAENQIGSTELLHVKGDAEVIAPFSEVTARDIGGSLTIDGSNQSVAVERVGGNLRVQHKNGKVDARAITGSATLLCNLTAVTLTEVGGDAEVRSPSAAVRITRVDGKTVAENSAFALDLIDLRGDVDARASGGLLRARFGQLPADGRARTIELEAAGGQIDLELPVDASAEIELVSTSGQLDAELPGIVIEQNGSARIGTLRLGSGTAKIRATCVGGPVRAHLSGN